MKKRWMIPLLISAVLFLGLCCLISSPVISYKTGVPDHYLEAIESQAKGIYSQDLPLIAVYVSADRCVEDTVFYTIYYFPFGTVGMSYSERDGYNIEKPLTGM